jgi:hypothetical protein
MFGPPVLSELSIAEDSNQEGAKAEVRSKDKPANQYGEKASPKRTRDAKVQDHKAHELDSTKMMSERVKGLYDQARADVINAIKSASSLSDAKDKINFTLGITRSAMSSTLNSFVNDGIDNGYASARPGQVRDSLAAKESSMEFESFVDKTITNVKNNVINILDNVDVSDSDKPQRVSAIFDLHNQYVKDASETIMTRAFNYGKALALRDEGHTSAEIKSCETSCSDCKNKAGKLDLTKLTFSDVPPHHRKCGCEVSLRVDHTNE